jgi:hypothetical protein
MEVDGIKVTYHNPSSIIAAFSKFWATLYTPTVHFSGPRPWLHRRQAPLPPLEVAKLTSPITVNEFEMALDSTREGAPGTDGLDAVIL